MAAEDSAKTGEPSCTPSPAASSLALHPGRPQDRVPPVVRREETSPKEMAPFGDTSAARRRRPEEAAVAAAADDRVAAAEVGADNGAHRLRFEDAGLSSGSEKSESVSSGSARHGRGAGLRVESGREGEGSG